MSKQMKCNLESCYLTGENFVSFGDKLITICDIHYTQMRRVGEQLQNYANSDKNLQKFNYIWGIEFEPFWKK